MVSCQDVEMQTLFLFWDSWGETFQKKTKTEFVLCICWFEERYWLGSNDTTGFIETRLRNKIVESIYENSRSCLRVSFNDNHMTHWNLFEVVNSVILEFPGALKFLADDLQLPAVAFLF